MLVTNLFFVGYSVNDHFFYICAKKNIANNVYSEDVSANLNALETLHSKHNTQLLLIESGGDNLAANYR